MGVTAVSSVKYMWRLNEIRRGRRWELNSCELRAKQPSLCTEGLLTELSMRCLTHTVQLFHLYCSVLLNACLSKATLWHSQCSAVTVGSCCWVGNTWKSSLACTTHGVRVPLCCSCPCVDKQGAMALCWGSRWELSTGGPFWHRDGSHHSRVSYQLSHMCCGQSHDAVWLLKSRLGGNQSPAWFLFLSMFSLFCPVTTINT